MLMPNSVIVPSSWLRNGIGCVPAEDVGADRVDEPELRREQHAARRTRSPPPAPPTAAASRRAPGRARGTSGAPAAPRRARGRSRPACRRPSTAPCSRRRQEVRRGEQQVVVAQRVLAAEHVEAADLQQPDALEGQDQRPQHRQHHHHQHDDDGGRDERQAGARVAPRAGVPRAAPARRGGAGISSWAATAVTAARPGSPRRWPARPWRPRPGPCRRSRRRPRWRSAAHRRSAPISGPWPWAKPQRWKFSTPSPSEAIDSSRVELAQRRLRVHAALELRPRGLELLRVLAVAERAPGTCPAARARASARSPRSS